MADIYSILRGRFPAHEYVLMAEVRDKAGFDGSRSADFIAVNLYPSRGLAINGIELKSNRGDWLNELKNPKKAENIFQYCDHFWLLTSDEKVAKIEEVPISWGWLLIKGEKIYTKKKAPTLKPKPVTKSFMCAMLKRANDKTGFIQRDSVKDVIEKAREDGKEDSLYTIKKLNEELNEVKKNIMEFEQASGVSMNRMYSNNFWDDPTKMGEAFKFVHHAGGTESIKKQLLRLEETAKDIVEKISNGIKSIPE